MRKRFDDIYYALMLAMMVGAVLAGLCILSEPIERMGGELPPIPVTEAHIALPQAAPEPDPAPLPTPTPIPYDPAIPLSPELQAALREACAEHGVPVVLVLGVIEVESGFQAEAVSAEGCYGLMQLNPKYFPDGLSPADNLREGVAHLGGLVEEYGDTPAALTAYNAGWDTGSRVYAGAVLEAAERWGL